VAALLTTDPVRTLHEIFSERGDIEKESPLTTLTMVNVILTGSVAIFIDVSLGRRNEKYFYSMRSKAIDGWTRSVTGWHATC